MKKLKYTLLVIILLSVSITTYATNNGRVHVDGLNYCHVSKAAMNDYEPAVFNTTNNLLRHTGEEELFCGEAIIVHGKVLDQNCVPISDAKVYVWQANCKGKYPYRVLKEHVVDKKIIDEKSSSTFVGNGITTTNNKGEFYFITVYPPTMHNYGPHLNVRVEPFGMSCLQTRLILKGHRVQNPQSSLDPAPVVDIAVKTGVKIYKFEVVVPGIGHKNY